MTTANGSSATGSSPWPSGFTPVEAFFAALGMCTLMLTIVFGNLMVILVLTSDQKLRSQRHNWLIVSLAGADLLVGLLVMPLTMTYEIIGAWGLGNVLCELWLAMDVLFVTASILHICVISLDRYWTVTRPLTYPASRTALKIWLMIGAAWVFSLLISLPPLLGWRPQRQPGECEVSNDLGYVLYSALGSFYVPVIVLITAYWRIYTVTRQRTQQQLRASFKVRSMLRNSVDLTKTRVKDRPRISVDGDVNGKTPLRFMDSDAKPIDDDTLDALEEARIQRENKRSVEKRRKSLKLRERQSTLLLGLILGAFIACWLPFFMVYVLGAFGYQAPDRVFKVFFWLGYCNSGINPFIYTIFNRDFKKALCQQLNRQGRHCAMLRQSFPRVTCSR